MHTVVEVIGYAVCVEVGEVGGVASVALGTWVYRVLGKGRRY